MRALHPCKRNIPLRKVCENHADIQLVKLAPSLIHSKRNPQELMSHVREIFLSSGKNESTNVRFTQDCTKFFKSGAYFHTVELENMPSRDSKLSGSMKKRLIYFDLMIGRDARKAKRDKSILESGTKVLNTCRNIQKGEFCH